MVVKGFFVVAESHSDSFSVLKQCIKCGLENDYPFKAICYVLNWLVV